MILVFDSGVGGFSILKEIRKQHSTTPVVYLADQNFFPYGDKSAVWLSKRLRQVAVWAHTYKPEIFVIACNTATVSAIAEMRSIVSCPVVGVEPVIKPLAGYQHAMVLATKATVNAPRTRELLNTFGSHVSVVSPAGLADAIENNNIGQVKKILGTISEQALRENIQAIGLSCTHYPLVTKELSTLLSGVHLYDPSSAVVSQINKLLSVTKPPDDQVTPTTQFFTTGSVVRFNEQIVRYLGIITQAKKVDI